jgi:hypothetical protein
MTVSGFYYCYGIVIETNKEIIKKYNDFLFKHSISSSDYDHKDYVNIDNFVKQLYSKIELIQIPHDIEKDFIKTKIPDKKEKDENKSNPIFIGIILRSYYFELKSKPSKFKILSEKKLEKINKQIDKFISDFNLEPTGKLGYIMLPNDCNCCS